MSNRQQKYLVLGFILLMFFVMGGDCDINAVHFLVTDTEACGGTVSPLGKETKQGTWSCDTNQVFSVQLFPCACRSMDVIARSPEIVINTVSGTAISFQRVRGDQNSWFVEVKFYAGTNGTFLLTPDPSCIPPITVTPTPTPTPGPASWWPGMTPTPTPTPRLKPTPTPTPIPCSTPPYWCPDSSLCVSYCPSDCSGYPRDPATAPGVCRACRGYARYWCPDSSSCVHNCYTDCPYYETNPTGYPWECTNGY